MVSRIQVALLSYVRWENEERGAGMVEYALLVALIAIVCFAAIVLLGETTGSKYVDVADSVSSF